MASSQQWVVHTTRVSTQQEEADETQPLKPSLYVSYYYPRLLASYEGRPNRGCRLKSNKYGMHVGIIDCSDYAAFIIASMPSLVSLLM